MKKSEARAEAIKSGATSYDTGEPCRRGHISKRWVSNHACVKCANTDSAEYWANRVDRRREVGRNQYAKNPAAKLAANKEWKSANASLVKAITKAWRETNKEAARAQIRAWQVANTEKVNAYSRNHSALKRGAGGSHTGDDITSIRKVQKDKCAICAVRLKGKGHVDHIFPLSKGGSNWPKNLQLLCVSCNTSKGARHPIEFAQSKGMLL